MKIAQLLQVAPKIKKITVVMHWSNKIQPAFRDAWLEEHIAIAKAFAAANGITAVITGFALNHVHTALFHQSPDPDEEATLSADSVTRSSDFNREKNATINLEEFMRKGTDSEFQVLLYSADLDGMACHVDRFVALAKQNDDFKFTFSLKPWQRQGRDDIPRLAPYPTTGGKGPYYWFFESRDMVAGSTPELDALYEDWKYIQNRKKTWTKSQFYRQFKSRGR